MVYRHLGDASGSVTRKNKIYTNLGCKRFWSDHFHLLHEYFHTVRQWGRGMTEWSYLWSWRQREREADGFAQQKQMEYTQCLGKCSPRCSP